MSPPRQLLAFDFGRKRIGVASGNTVLGRAQPLATVPADDRRHDAIARLVREWRPDALVVGIPRHPDGNPHRNTTLAERFARELEARTGLPVHRVDERYSTVEAERESPDARGGVDAAAAAVILDQFLSQPPAPGGDTDPTDPAAAASDDDAHDARP